MNVSLLSRCSRASVRCRNGLQVTRKATMTSSIRYLRTAGCSLPVTSTSVVTPHKMTFNSTGRRTYCSSLPAHTKVALPALSPTMEMGSIVSWEKKEGDQLSEGDLLAEIETDKATMGFETPEEGFLAKILLPAGTKDIPLGKLLCIIVENESDIAAFKDYVPSGDDAGAKSQSKPSAMPKAKSPPPPSPAKISAASSPQVVIPSAASSSGVGGRLFASPLAKRLAAEQGVDLSTIGSGSGSSGRIIASDLSRASSVASSASSTTASFQDIALSGMRRAIARRLTQSKQTIPHYYLTVDAQIDQLLRLRKEMNESLGKEGVKLSVNDFLIKASALSCIKVPEVNSQWNETFIRQFNVVDVSIAVSTDAGLITPIIFDADTKGLKQISEDVRLLATKGREGKLQPNEFEGGTFTISNLGMFGIKQFCAVINPPQSAILAVGGNQQVALPNGGSGSVISLTLSCDHRVVDGAVGAQWLVQCKKFLEQPFTMVL